MILASVLRLEEKISIAFSRLHWLTSWRTHKHLHGEESWQNQFKKSWLGTK
jgi:hypothetical protein